MTTHSIGPCTVCDHLGRCRCSGCKVARFCSPRCQRLLWPVHKALCGQDPAAFVLPPLTAADAEALERVKNEVFECYEQLPFAAFVSSLRIGIFRQWETFLELVTAAKPPIPDLMAMRNDLLLESYAHLGWTAHLRPQPERAPVWHTFGIIVLPVRHNRLGGYPRGCWPFYRDFNALLRQELVYSRLVEAETDPRLQLSRRECWALQDLARKRVDETIERMELPGDAKASLLGLCQSLLWPTHKFLCGRDPTTFALLPFTRAEIEELEGVKHMPYIADAARSSFLDFATVKPEATGSSSSWTTFLSLLTESTPVDEDLWSTHKVLCGRPTDAFFLPPIEGADLQKLREDKHKPLRESGVSLFDEIMQDVAGGGRAQAEAMYWSSVSGQSSPIAVVEHVRMTNLLTAYDFLWQIKQREAQGAKVKPVPSPWELIAGTADDACGAYFTGWEKDGVSDALLAQSDRDGPRTFHVLNAYFRQLLVHATLFVQLLKPNCPASSVEVNEFVRRGHLRTFEDLESADLPRWTKAWLKEGTLRAIGGRGVHPAQWQ